MQYQGPSLEKINSVRSSAGVYRNLQDGFFRLFPLTSNNARLEIVPGCFLRKAGGKIVSESESEADKLASQIYEFVEQDTPAGSLELVKRTLYEICEAASSRETNDLRIALASKGDAGADKVAWYLVSMAGDADRLREIVQKAIGDAGKSANVIERLVACVVPIEDSAEKESTPYFNVNRSLSVRFLEDLEWVLSSEKAIGEYLSNILEFYCFMFIAQSCLTVERRLEGEREVAPLYFALDWEKTTQSRRCYKQGFKKLEPAIENMFVHAGILEILNTNDSGEQYDYIAINRAIEDNPAIEPEIAAAIRSVTETCRMQAREQKSVELFSDIELPSESPFCLKDEIDYLYKTIRAILFNTDRNQARNRYSNAFRIFCQGGLRFEKVRGRSGTMLNLTEETLLLLTAVSVGNKESLSLVELFRSFETRGVFLDEPSREAVAEFYDRRNMLDKKSDSGETQYVKRIL